MYAPFEGDTVNENCVEVDGDRTEVIDNTAVILATCDTVEKGDGEVENVGIKDCDG